MGREGRARLCDRVEDVEVQPSVQVHLAGGALAGVAVAGHTALQVGIEGVGHCVLRLKGGGPRVQGHEMAQHGGGGALGLLLCTWGPGAEARGARAAATRTAALLGASAQPTACPIFLGGGRAPCPCT